jgi:MYXO-CTERM domain-containing protein
MKKMYMAAIAVMTAFYPAQHSFAQNSDRSEKEMKRTGDDDDDDNTGKWGLLGLLGLIGLAGLKKRDDDRVVRTTRTDR